MSIRLSGAATAALLLASPALAHAQGAGFRYDFGTGGERGKDTDAVVYVLGDRSRIEPAADGEGDDRERDYIILRDGDLIVVDPDARTYSVNKPDLFESIVGTALRAVSPLVQMHVDDISISTVDLGLDETILGYRTRHYRMTQRFSVTVRALGIHADDRPKVHEIISDYWVAPDLKLPRNPLVEVVAAAPSALAQQSRTFAKTSAASRDSLFTGMPLRVIVRSREGATGNFGKAVRIDVSRIERVTLTPDRFEVPAGFKRTDKLTMNSM